MWGLGSIPGSPSLGEKGKKEKATETQRLAWLMRMMIKSTPRMGMYMHPLWEMYRDASENIIKFNYYVVRQSHFRVYI